MTKLAFQKEKHRDSVSEDGSKPQTADRSVIHDPTASNAMHYHQRELLHFHIHYPPWLQVASTPLRNL